MIKKICVVLCLGALVGCAHGKAEKRTVRSNIIKVERAGSSPSFCFDGLMWKMAKAGCKQVAFENISIGYTRFWCADDGATEAKNPLQTEEFFVIGYNRLKGQYARTIPEDTLALCADPSALLVTAPRD